MVGVSVSVNLPLHHKGWSWKKAVKRLWCGVVVVCSTANVKALFVVINQGIAGHCCCFCCKCKDYSDAHKNATGPLHSVSE